MNLAILTGNVGKDTEARHLENGKVVVNFSLATNERYKNKQGEEVTNTEWHKCVAWSPLAEVIEKYVKKGDKLYIEGSITTRKWQDKEGNDRYTTEVKAFNMTLLGGTEKKSTQQATVVVGEEDDLPF